MFQPYVITKVGEMRRQVLLQEADLARQLRSVRGDRTGHRRGSGNLLMAISRQFKASAQVFNAARGDI